MIKLENFPIIWVSKMTTDIALSTTEAENISMSQSTRDFIPLKQYMLDVMSVFEMKCDSCISYLPTFKYNKVTI